MIKLAFNKENPNLVFEIDSIDRVAVGEAGIEEKYLGTLIDTSTVPDTHKENYRVQVAGFEMKWTEVPVDLGSTGDINNQDKTVTPTTSQQTVKPDSGYTGLSSVKVKAAPLETKTIPVKSYEQTITPSDGKIGFSSVTVEQPLLLEDSVTPTTQNQIIRASSPFVGLSEVQVAGVTSSIDANITAGNIKKDVTILGVTGSYEGSGGGGDLKTDLPTYLTNGKAVPTINLSSAASGYIGLYLAPFLKNIGTSQGMVVYWTGSTYASASGPYYWIQYHGTAYSAEEYYLYDLSTGNMVTKIKYASGQYTESNY